MINRKIVLVLSTLLALNFAAVAQKVSLKLNDVTVKEAMLQLEKQSKYSFVYKVGDVDTEKKVSVDARQLNDAVRQILDGQDVDFEISGRSIVVKKVFPNHQNSMPGRMKRKVGGLVKDESGELVAGATVKVVGTTFGTATDMDGRFSFDKVDDGATLEISFIGYRTERIKLGLNDWIDIQLVEDYQQLDEVVALGYGAQARKQDLSASVGVIQNVEKIAVRPLTGTTAMLQGQIPGVTVQANGANGYSMVIRGQGSQNGDGVLWVVDGVPGGAYSMDDVESIVVLKDAASAAIYGAQSGAGGVVLVTTKRAKKGLTRISYNTTMGVKAPYNLIHGLNAEEEIAMRKMSYANAGMEIPTGWDVAKNPYVGVTRTDWVDKIFRNAFYQRHNVALESGNDNSQHRLSLNVYDNPGTMENTYNKSVNLKYRGNFELGDYVSVSEDFNYGDGTSRSCNTDDGYYGIYTSAIWMPSSAEVYNPLDGTFGGIVTEDPEYIAKYGSNFSSIHGDVVNPMRMLLADNIYNKSNTMTSTSTLTIKNVITGLKFISRLTYIKSNSYNKSFTPIRDEVGKPNLNNSLSENSSRSDAWKTENTLTYDNSLGRHTVGALLAMTTDYTKGRGLSINGSGFADESPYLQYIAYASSISASDWMSGPDGNVAVVSRLSYSFGDRYFLTASWRKDWAGRLPKENNSGTFPAVTAAWKISNEDFFPKTDAFNFLKLRASWGRVGNLGSIGWNYKSATLSGEWVDRQAHYGATTNERYRYMYYLGTALNPNLTWETSEQSNVGIDAAFLKSRFSISLDYFEKKTNNLIQTQSMDWPNTIGVSAMKINLGEIRNRGVEFAATWRDKIGHDMSYWMGGNVAWLKNWVSDIGVKADDGSAGVWTGGGGTRGLSSCYQTCEGGPLNQFYLIRHLGLFQSDEEVAGYVNKDGNKIQPNAKAGDLKFEDFNGDGKIDLNDRQYFGSATPKWTYMLQGGIDYQNFWFDIQFQGVGKAQAYYAGKYLILADHDGSFNRAKEILDAWTPTNTGSKIPRVSKTDPNNNFSYPSTWYLESASYLRLKTMTVGCDLSALLHNMAYFKERNSRLAVSLSGENLFTITHYSGVDPECGGWDAMKYPLSRVFSFNLKLTY